MEALGINYWAVIVGAIFSMILGGQWYGTFFGKQWMTIIGMDPNDTEAMKNMKKTARPLYLLQFSLTSFQILVLAHLVADTQLVSGLERSLWICAAFIIPTLAGTVIWTNQSKQLKWSRFLIQGGYQVTLFIVLGLLLHYWK